MSDLKCPFRHAASQGKANRQWWPNQPYLSKSCPSSLRRPVPWGGISTIARNSKNSTLPR